MANAGPNTNGSQFFLISGSSGVQLPPQYSLFGKIVNGLDVLDAMQRATDRNDRREDVVINSVTIDVADDDPPRSDSGIDGARAQTDPVVVERSSVAVALAAQGFTDRRPAGRIDRAIFAACSTGSA